MKMAAICSPQKKWIARGRGPSVSVAVQRRGRCVRVGGGGGGGGDDDGMSREEDVQRSLRDRVLKLVEDTDRGVDATRDRKREIATAIESLRTEVDADGDDASVSSYLDDERIFGNYDVAYTASGDDYYGEPAGGRFRGALGRRLFKTTTVRQALYEPNIVVNEVTFMLLGFLSGRVSLAGTFSLWQGDSVNKGDGDRVAERDTRNTVRAYFEQPELELGRVKMRIGPKSTVVLSTTYLDDKLRLGVGGRGSLFVFRRINNDRTRPERSSPQTQASSSSSVGRWAAIAAVAGFLAAAKAMSTSVAITAGGLLVLLLLCAALVMRNGGIIGTGGRNELADTSSSDTSDAQGEGT